jgi:hypothetical protein
MRKVRRKVTKENFYKESEQFFDHFPKYHMKILLGDFNAKLGRQDIFKPTIGNGSLYQDSSGNGLKIVNFATSKNLVVKSTMFPQLNVHKYTWTSLDGRHTIRLITYGLIGDGIRLYSMYDLSWELTLILITIWWLQKLGRDWQ